MSDGGDGDAGDDARASAPGGGPGPEEVEAILDTIGDRLTRHVLAAAGAEARSAKSIAEELDLSLPTVYRHLEALEEHDLIAERTEIADDGNHYRVFEATFDSTVISLEGEEYRIEVFRRDDVPDLFAQLWDELSRR